MNATAEASEKTQFFQSSIFKLETVQFSDRVQQIMRGGREHFPLLDQAFTGIRQIGVIGWGSQAPAQAQNLRDSLHEINSGIVVKVGLRKDSKSWDEARNAGFSVMCEEGESTLGTIDPIVSTSDLVLLLVSDGGATKIWEHVVSLMKPGATLGLSHGFLIGYLKSIGRELRPDINVILMAPKGMGKSVRLLYQQGASTNGAGINSSIAVHQDVNGKALDYALGWALATGSPVTFFTTMEREVISDLTGERAMLLGGIAGLAEALFTYFTTPDAQGGNAVTGAHAFLYSAKGLTSTVSQLISEYGLIGLFHKLDHPCQMTFIEGYRAAYGPASKVIAEIYEEVSSWREITDVVTATEALEHTPMSDIEASRMWAIGKDLYGDSVKLNQRLAFSAGMYVAGIMAQLDLLREKGHNTPEVINESLIEAVDSLNPFMDRRGVAYMVDNCSTTARLGTRKWSPQFKTAFLRATSEEVAGSVLDWNRFLNNPLHGDIELCYALRPTAKIHVE